MHSTVADSLMHLNNCITVTSNWCTSADLVNWSINCQSTLYLASLMMLVDETNLGLQCMPSIVVTVRGVFSKLTAVSRHIELLGWVNSQSNWTAIRRIHYMDLERWSWTDKNLVLDSSRLPMTDKLNCHFRYFACTKQTYKPWIRISFCLAADYLCLSNHSFAVKSFQTATSFVPSREYWRRDLFITCKRGSAKHSVKRP
jgi:hypothetical protein